MQTLTIRQPVHNTCRSQCKAATALPLGVRCPTGLGFVFPSAPRRRREATWELQAASGGGDKPLRKLISDENNQTFLAIGAVFGITFAVCGFLIISVLEAEVEVPETKPTPEALSFSTAASPKAPTGATLPAAPAPAIAQDPAPAPAPVPVVPSSPAPAMVEAPKPAPAPVAPPASAPAPAVAQAPSPVPVPEAPVPPAPIVAQAPAPTPGPAAPVPPKQSPTPTPTESVSSNSESANSAAAVATAPAGGNQLVTLAGGIIVSGAAGAILLASKGGQTEQTDAAASGTTDGAVPTKMPATADNIAARKAGAQMWITSWRERTGQDIVVRRRQAQSWIASWRKRTSA